MLPALDNFNRASYNIFGYTDTDAEYYKNLFYDVQCVNDNSRSQYLFSDYSLLSHSNLTLKNSFQSFSSLVPKKYLVHINLLYNKTPILVIPVRHKRSLIVWKERQSNKTEITDHWVLWILHRLSFCVSIRKSYTSLPGIQFANIYSDYCIRL